MCHAAVDRHRIGCAITGDEDALVITFVAATVPSAGGVLRAKRFVVARPTLDPMLT